MQSLFLPALLQLVSLSVKKKEILFSLYVWIKMYESCGHYMLVLTSLRCLGLHILYVFVIPQLIITHSCPDTEFAYGLC